jgi:long-chain acyl-CoA synthetase
VTAGEATFEEVEHLGVRVPAFAGRPGSHHDLLRRAAARWPDRAAVEAPSGCVGYAELDRLVSAAATAVRHVAAPGERVALALGHDLPMAIAPFVASRAGVTALLLNPSLTPDRWAQQLARADPVAVIADAGALAAATAAAAPGGHLVVRDDLAWALDGPVDEGVAAAEGAGAGAPQVLALIATSGTTGVPKMTQVTSAGLLHAALAYVHLLGLQDDERTWVCLPLQTIGPLSAQLTTMPLLGGTAVLPHDTGAAGAARALAAATYLDAVPAWLAGLARDLAADPRAELPALRTVIYGGAPMPPDVVAALARRLPHAALWDVWGLSETSGPATAVRVDPAAPAMPGVVGRAIPGVQVAVADGEEVSQAPGAVGELLVRGLNVTPGYADDPALSARVLRDGWLRTGDVGTVGPDGSIRLLDRAKDVILRGGANVFSVEVEQVLGTHPDVVEAAVYGVPDGLGEEAVAASVVLRDGAALDVMALRRLVDAAVGRHAVPRRIAAVGALPRNANGKVDKRALRAAAALR